MDNLDVQLFSLENEASWHAISPHSSFNLFKNVCERLLIDWLIDSFLFEYGNFISYITSLHESRIETEVNTVQLH